MAKICSLFSGSKGNCIYIENKDTALLVDVGVSAKRITEALAQRQLDISKIKAVFITHEHSDHVGGVRVFSAKNGIPVYSTLGTFNGMKDGGYINEKNDCRILTEETDLKDIGVTYFNTLHDATEPCGYVFDLGQRKISVCTDLGIVTDEVHNAVNKSDAIFLESNHDIKMLQSNSAYPFPLKRRILSEKGHLSNTACADEAKSLIEGGTTRVILSHLSENNNLPWIARETTKSLLTMKSLEEGKDYLLSVSASQGNDVIII